MKRILFILAAVLFGLLLGTGLQFFLTGMFTFFLAFECAEDEGF